PLPPSSRRSVSTQIVDLQIDWVDDVMPQVQRPFGETSDLLLEGSPLRMEDERAVRRPSCEASLDDLSDESDDWYRPSLADLQYVVSTGALRLGGGQLDGGGNRVRSVRNAIVVGVGMERSIAGAAVSVPVFTSQRWTPQRAKRSGSYPTSGM